MPKDGTATREKILNKAKELMLTHGFAATSIDSLIEQVGITKGAFFYHFKSKAELARAMIERHAQEDTRNLENGLRRAEQLHRDPLQQVLIFIALLEEQAQEMMKVYPGCLFASFCYEERMFEREIMQVCVRGFMEWRERLAGKIQQVIERTPPRLPVTAEGLADLVMSILQGAFVYAKTLDDSRYIREQLGHFRNYLELLFAPPSSPS